MSAKEICMIPVKPRLVERQEVGVYCRVSTRSVEQIASLAAQVSEMVRFVRRAGVSSLHDVYIDVMSGAQTENRPGYQRMMEDCRNHSINLIVCKSISRFGRNMVEMLQSIREIKEYGVNVFFQLENLNTQDARNELIMSLIEACREEEIKGRSESIRMGCGCERRQGHRDTIAGAASDIKKMKMGNWKSSRQKRKSYERSMEHTWRERVLGESRLICPERGSSHRPEKTNGTSG